jgi:putative tryptophan/tyrosine transport system substrate-binding protein
LVRRREFITLVGSAAAGWPLAARAQQGERIRRITVLMGVAEDALNKANIAALLARLDELGWKDGHNLRTDVRWWAGGPQQMQSVIADMLASSPDVVIAVTNLAVAVLKPVAGNVPVVFLGVGDPVGSGFVTSLAHPGGNITGFATYDGPMGGKWLEVLKQTAPHLTRILTILQPETPIHQAFWHSIQDAAPHFGLEVTPGGVHDGSEIENAITAFAVKENSGLIVLPHAVTNVNRELIVALALRHSLPAIDAIGNANAGGLVSYGADIPDQYRRAAEYVDHTLRGQKPSDLPVQQPTKFILVFNLRTARVIGLELPHNLLVLADKVIE